jgi:hypothetical protein
MPKYRKMLSDWEAPAIQSLIKQIETQSKITLANWALDYAEARLLPIWNRQHASDQRPADAIQAARAWLAKEIKLPAAKADILACHAAAREMEAEPAAQAAARAIGQCAATIHSARHCIGLALYGALAIAYDQLGPDTAWAELESSAYAACADMLTALEAVSVPNESNPAKIVWVC